MPMFDFHCPTCQNLFEDLVFGDEIPPCPQCGEVRTERRVSAPSPQKTGAFPFKVGPVHPVMHTPTPSCGGNCSGGCSGSSCPSGAAEKPI